MSRPRFDPDEFELLKEILEKAPELDPADRPAFLREACPNEAVRREAASLLGHEDTAARVEALRAELHPERSGPGERIGPYRVVEVLGEGGMGTVVLAEREEGFQMRVAVKLVRPDRLSTELVGRFHAERQILAGLDHPNIARIFDGGTTADGRPYFAMEYVEGQPIDAWCDERQLSVRRRVELFLRVCAAVETAHRSLVIHRDLKPSNILVTAEGIPKLLDFGIARQIAAPETRLHPMTPEYASPEQIRERPLTTASDVYSLGVVLYRLLTGRSPYGETFQSGFELQEAICHSEPPRPSAAAAGRRDVARRLAGDLDSIVEKALAKEPRERYGSVEKLAEDLRRHLDGRPVAARRGAWPYHAGKFLRRHRWPVLTAAALLIAALTGAVLWREAERGRDRRATTVALLEDLLRLPNPNEELSVEDFLDRAVAKVGELDDEPLVQAELLEPLGNAQTSLDLYEEAEATLGRARELWLRHGPEPHPRLARITNNLAYAYHLHGDDDAAEPLYLEALEMRRALGHDGVELTKLLSNLASIRFGRGEYATAERLYREVLEIRLAAYGPDDTDVATTLRSLGNLLYTLGRHAEAEPLIVRALEIRQGLIGPGHLKVAAVWSTLGRVLHALSRHAEAEDAFTRCLEIRRAHFGEEHSNVAVSRRDLAALYLDLGRLDDAAALLGPVLDVLRDSKHETRRAETDSVHGALLAARGRYAEAEPLLVESYVTLERLRGAQAVQTRTARRRLGELYTAWQRPEKLAALGDAP